MPVPTTTPDLVDIVEQLRPLVQGDGADLRLVTIDDRAQIIELALELEGANCADCVLPPARLQVVLAASLVQRGVTSHRLVLHDPRRGATSASAADRIIVLDPTGEVDASVRDPGPDAGPLVGRTVGFRVDALWQCWDWVVDAWTRALESAGVTVRSWRRVQGLSGLEGAEADDAYQQFLESVDVAIVGLGNCGSCTSWTIRDAIEPATLGLPTAAVVTEQFVPLAGMLARHYGRAGLRTHVLPFPLQTRPEAEVRAIALDTFPALLLTLGASV
jgi:Fe-S cluster biogenesis protein NfuA